MTAPTPAVLALLRSTLPVRRVASVSSSPSGFATLLRKAALKQPPPRRPTVVQRATPVQEADLVAGGPAPVSRSEIMSNAEKFMGIPYVWGGTSTSGLDCSAFVSKVWGVPRQTTETLSSVSHPISKDELQLGDALNLTVGKDPDGDGHVRLFDRWADAAHTKMSVYEETPPKSVHHVIEWDPKYQPMRRNNVVDG
jgi:cell wall-associated NlpC family hydrolase